MIVHARAHDDVAWDYVNLHKNMSSRLPTLAEVNAPEKWAVAVLEEPYLA